MKVNKKEKIDYEEILDSIGFKELNSFDKKNMIMILKTAILDRFYKEYPNNVQKQPLFGLETIDIYLWKYLNIN